jgi:4-amino-4-deoxy-L-arabinose transferase-like glycosyltransferase
MRLRDGLSGIPSAAWWCAAVAFVNVAVWATIVPPFQVPDETSHVAYVQYLAETGEAPNDPEGGVFSDEEARLLEALQFNSTVGRPTEGTIWSELQDQEVDRVEDEALDPGNAGGIQSNSNQPPLYYLLGAGVYWLSPSDGLLDRVMLLRLFSALLAALTTIFVFLFLREIFAERWTWTVGSLAVAFQPTFGFVSGGVTPDALMFCASAALFFAMARVFRRGLTVERGLAVGAVLSVGALAKLNFLALIPGALAGVVLMAWRARDRTRALPALGAAGGLLAVAALAYVAVNLGLWDRSAWGGGLSTAGTNVTGGGDGVPAVGLTERLGYTWQLYLPRLPFMADQFTYFPPYTTWFKGSIGLFGWLDTRLPNWTYTAALVVFMPLILLALLALIQRRHRLRERWPELVTYGLMAAGLAVSIGFSGSRYRKDTGFIFEQARYLLPLLPLYAAFIALAALGAGRRFARPLGALLVVLAMGHAVFAQLLVIGRYYA